MAWTSLSTRLSSLPLVLAGPILRRVEPEVVTVWIALREPRTVRMDLWLGVHRNNQLGTSMDNSTSIHSTISPSIRIGANLHLVLLSMDLSNTPLGAGMLYSYNISFSPSTDLNTEGLLEDKDDTFAKSLALGFVQGQLPTFIVPGLDLNDLVIAHGSCRKAHGAGIDALSGLDNIIKNSLINGSVKRPHLLFLTGDQIYADDVALPLLPLLTDAANVLVSGREKIPVEGVLHTVNQTNFPLGRRAKLVNETAKFTCGSAGMCHLLSFGEYCATYLFYWSNVLWPDPDTLANCKEVENVNEAIDCKNNIIDILKAEIPPNSIKKFLDNDISENEDIIAQYRNELFAIKEFYKTLPQVRRVFANVPLLMQHDDHDVTDDWNLTRDWQNRVLTNALGSAIVRNALSAFALFQGWGNQDYRNSDTHPFKSLISTISGLCPDSADSPSANEAIKLLNLFGLNGNEPEIEWNFSIKAGPTRVVVLDTRTHRSYLSQYSAPNLISHFNLQKQLPPSLVTSSGAELVIIVSPVPVLGLPLIEHLFQPLMIRIQELSRLKDGKKKPGNVEYDLEPWAADPEGLENLLARLHELKKVVILSGDVHYAFSGCMNYWKPATGTVSRIVQLTSSASKNVITSKNIGKILSTGTGQRLSLHLPERTLKVRGWQNNSDLIGHINLPPGITLPPNLRYMSHRSPVVLPEHGWPAGTSIDTAITIQPEWVWHFEIAKDNRSDDDVANSRQEAARDKTVEFSQPNAGTDYVKILDRGKNQLEKNVSRVSVFPSNIGLVHFQGTGDSLVVSHKLLYRIPKVTEPDTYTEHDVSMKLADSNGWIAL